MRVERYSRPQKMYFVAPPVAVLLFRQARLVVALKIETTFSDESEREEEQFV